MNALRKEFGWVAKTHEKAMTVIVFVWFHSNSIKIDDSVSHLYRHHRHVL